MQCGGLSGESEEAVVIIPVLLAALADPNCWPRHPLQAREIPTQTYHYHSHWYHPPLQPICRDPWPEDHLAELRMHPQDLPHSPVPPPPAALDLGHVPTVVWPGYQPSSPASNALPTATSAHKPHGAPAARSQSAPPAPPLPPPPPPPVSVPEPGTWSLLVLGLGGLLGRGTRRLRASPVRRRE
jgi:hypothetical protein